MVETTSILSGTILFIRDILRANITDPISSSRPSNEKFIMTSYPDRPVNYPIITVKGKMVGDRPAGQRSENRIIGLEAEIRIWGRNEKEKYELNDIVYNFLRLNQYPGVNTFYDQQLFDFSLTSAVPVDETGKAGIKSMVLTYDCTFYTNTDAPEYIKVYDDTTGKVFYLGNDLLFRIKTSDGTLQVRGGVDTDTIL